MHSKCHAECCNDLTPIPKELYEKNVQLVVNKILEIKPLYDALRIQTESGKCCFLNADFTCNIYENRPELCRKFGDESHPMMKCRWMSKCGRERSRQDKRMIERSNAKWVGSFNKWATNI